MAEELSIEVGHSPSKPSKDRKVRFSAEATGNVSKLVIVINGRLATTCIFEEETHLSVAPAALSRGLRAVFG